MSPRILDRYIAKETIGPAFIALVVFSFLFLINLLFQLANLVIQEGLSLKAAVLMFLYSLPLLLSYTLPVGFLAGTIIAFGRLSGDSEIVALRASGIKVSNLLRAPLAMGVLLAIALAVSNLWLIPAARGGQESLRQQASRMTNLMKLIKPGVFYDRIPGVLFYCEEVDPAKQRYEKVIIFQKPSPQNDMITVSEWGRLVESPEQGALQFLLGPGQTDVFDRARPEKVQVSSFNEQALTVVPATTTATANQRDLGSMTFEELLQRWRQSGGTVAGQRDMLGFRYEAHRRFAAAAIAILFALIGVPLGLTNARGGRGAGFSISLAVVLFYWILYSALGDLAMRGRLSPEAAAWLPDVAVFLAGLYFLKRRGDKPAEKKPSVLAEWWMGLIAKSSKKIRPVSEEAIPMRRDGWLSIVDKYLLTHLARYFLIIAGSILVLDWVIELRGLSEFLTNGERWSLFGRYLASQSVGIFMLLLPLCLLMTVLVVLGILEKGNEITAMKASGISLYRISLAILCVGFGVGMMAWMMGEGIAPAANRAAQRDKEALKNFVSKFLNVSYDVWLFAPNRGALYHYDHYDAKRELFEGFSFYALAPSGNALSERFYASEARFVGEKTLAYSGGWRWVASGGKDNRFKVIPSGELAAPADKNYFVIPPFLEGQTLSSGELASLIENLRQKGLPTERQRMDYYRKFADGATPLALLLAGLPFAFSVGRKGSLYGVAIALALAVAFYVLVAIFTAVGEMEWLAPPLAAWAPAVIFGLGGGYWILNLRS
ncbi:MAG: LptF/LptG family permease [Acidobacteria bacterium]|nr:LptF/LptG family permease [Acidobacteriota bacterium]